MKRGTPDGHEVDAVHEFSLSPFPPASPSLLLFSLPPSVLSQQYMGRDMLDVMRKGCMGARKWVTWKATGWLMVCSI